MVECQVINFHFTVSIIEETKSLRNRAYLKSWLLILTLKQFYRIKNKPVYIKGFKIMKLFMTRDICKEET